MTCPRAMAEETFQQIEAEATAETSPLINQKIDELSSTLSSDQKQLLNEIQDLYAKEAGNLVSTALTFRGCAKK